MARVFTRMMKDDSCATAMEYALIAALIVIAIVAGAATLGSTMQAGSHLQTQRTAMID